MGDRHDLGPAARRMADLVRGVGDHQLGAATPCTAYRVRDLLAHIEGLSQAFTAAAGKAGSPLQDGSPGGPLALPDGWRTLIPDRLSAVADSWRSAAAWDGMTRAGGVDLPGEIAGQVVLNELALHGWDLARATGQSYECDAATTEVCLAVVGMFPEGGDGPFGPPVQVPADAPAFERVLGRSGRDPRWTPDGVRG